MTDPALELLASIIAAARTAPAVVALFGGEDKVAVWEQAPPLEPGDEGADGFPYIEVPSVQVIADEPIEGQDLEDGETVTDDPSEAFADVHVYSRQRGDGTGGKPEAMAFVRALRPVLGRKLEVDGFRVTLGHLRDARHFTESDGLTAHSVATFRYLIQPA